jgi:hypothetical protein
MNIKSSIKLGTHSPLVTQTSQAGVGMPTAKSVTFKDNELIKKGGP